MSSQAYTPGLKRKAATLVQKTRKLPIPGSVLVKKDMGVKADDVLARTFIPGKVHVVNVAGLLGIDVWDTSKHMLKREVEKVEEKEPIAMSKTFFGLFKKYVYAPAAGIIERASDLTGQVILREPPVPIEVDAYIPGRIVKVFPKEGAVVETPAVFIQGIFGVGGERKGEVKMIVESPDEVLTADKILPEHNGKILIGGSLVDLAALQKAAAVGVKGIVAGGIEDGDLTQFLGYEIGVAITGHEDIPLTLIVTEGFGKMRMSEKTFTLLKKFDGRFASISGATQIRAGVLRPEIIVPRPELEDEEIVERGEEKEFVKQGLMPGTPVRIIREPYFGAIGVVVGLPVQLQLVETESEVRVLEAELEDGRRVVIPRANVEIIEE